MCLQCLTEATVVKEAVLPGFTLMQAQADNPLWPKGWYALVESNDPTIVFEGPLLLDPTAGLTEDDLDWQPALPDGYEEYDAGAQKMEPMLKCDPVTGFRLVQACMQEGFETTAHGSLAYWLLNHLAVQSGVKA